MIKGLIKKKIKQAVYELIKGLVKSITTAEYGYDPKTKGITVKFTKEW